MINKQVLQDIRDHANKEYPRESCGVVIVKKGKQTYIECRNIAEEDEFIIHPEDLADAEDDGEIICIVHSHPNSDPTPSEADKLWCNRSKTPWLIVGYSSDSIKYLFPKSYDKPLVGREYVFKETDCYTLVRDYYRINLNIYLPDIEYEEEWWTKGKNLYLDNYRKYGFEEVFGLLGLLIVF